MHNITKPDESQRFIKNNITEDSQCTTCHQNYNKHNTSVNCTLCHSDDVHVIQVFSKSAGYVNHGSPNQGNCTNCHQNATFLNALKAQPKAGSYTGRNPPQIPVPLNHSTDPLNGSLWNGVQPGYWVNTSQLSACYYCHGKSFHNSSALGSINTVKGTNSLNQNLTGSTWCANCHYGNAPNYAGNQFNPQPPEVLNKSGLVPAKSSDGTSFYNHSGALSSSYDDATCRSCHNNNLSTGATSLNFSHNVKVGSLGGPDCISCHNIGGITQHIVNNTAMDIGVHANINSNAVNGTGISSENKKCWACHQSNGQQPTGMGDRYSNPYKCYDCHNGTAPYPNVSKAPIVSNHFKSGLNITAQGSAPDDSSSCIACHNTGEMKVTYTGDNAGTNFSLPSHYGMKRTDLTGLTQMAYCTYCHNSSTENVTFGVSDFNNSIVNHSARPETAQCADCHDTIKEGLARLHNGTLVKPVSNDTLCKTCHGPGGSAPINGKVEHKNLYCTECHANGTGQLAGKDVHGIKYLAQNNTFSTSNSSAVDCVTCHQTTNVDSALVGFAPPRIMNPLHHSSNIANGTVFGNYWTSGTVTACIYCHSDTKHNATPLGRPLQWLGSSYQLSGAIGTNSTCADCHYKGSSNYAIMQSTFVSNGLPIPPEITNGSSWNGQPSYYNHSLGAYDDQTCKSCHGSLLSGNANMSEFLHNVAIGVAGGPNCISCHNIGGSAGTGRLVNVSAMNDTSAIHKNLNSGATSPSGYSSANFKCWACHGNGSEPGSSHPSNYKTPFRCPDCHVSGAGNFTPNSILTVSQHYWNGTSIKTTAVTSCYDCHNKSEMMLGQNLDPDGSASIYGGANGGSNSTSHYGKKRSDYPVQGTNDYYYQCHNNASTVFPFIDAANKTIANHSTNYASSPNCADCHASQAGRIHNSTLYKPTLNLPNSTFCLNCHGANGTATIKNKEQHNGTLNCTQCHLNSTRSIHPVQYLQQDGISWSTTKANAVNCTNCHQGAGVSGFDGAPKIPEPLNHSTDPYSGKKWGSYWDNTSVITACYYCHQNDIHENNTGLLGNVSIIEGSNTLNNPDLTNSTWCANCHYAGAQDYKGNLLAVSPPEITNSSLVASDGTLFFNHSGLSNFNDSNCKNCHGSAISGYSETSLNLSHSVSEGGGEDCVGCHGTSYIGASPSVARTFVNISAFNESIHQNLNATPPATVNNLDCWSCHYNKDMNRLSVKKCGDCHRKPSQWHGNANITTDLSQLW
jgi:Zn finger protein HypA/HybF involved in hydrogenase expression